MDFVNWKQFTHLPLRALDIYGRTKIQTQFDDCNNTESLPWHWPDFLNNRIQRISPLHPHHFIQGHLSGNMPEEPNDVDPVENFNLKDPFFSALRKMYLVSRDVAGHLDTWENWYIQQLEKDIRALKEKYGEEIDGEKGHSGVYNFDIADESCHWPKKNNSTRPRYLSAMWSSERVDDDVVKQDADFGNWISDDRAHSARHPMNKGHGIIWCADLIEFLNSVNCEVKRFYDYSIARPPFARFNPKTTRLEWGENAYNVSLEGHYFLYSEKWGRMILSVQINAYNTEFSLQVPSVEERNDHQVMDNFWDSFQEFHYCKGLLKGSKFDINFNYVKNRGRTWGDVVIDDAKKKIFNENVTFLLKNHDEFRDAGIKTSRGLILCGPPGVGKTLSCDALVSESEETVIYVTAEMVRKLGKIAGVFHLARRLAPTLLIVEDLDSIGGTQRGEIGAMGSMLSEFLNALDGITENMGVVTVASTNHPELMDWALICRPGRFDVRIDYHYPDKNKIQSMFEVKLLNKAISEKINVKQLASMAAPKFTGSHVEEVINHAAYIAASESNMANLDISQKHLTEAMNRTNFGILKFLEERRISSVSGEDWA